MSENFVIHLDNGALDIVPPSHFYAAKAQSQIEITNAHNQDVPYVERSHTDTVLAIGTIVALTVIIAVGVVGNNPQILEKLDQKLAKRHEDRLDSYQSGDSLQ